MLFPHFLGPEGASIHVVLQVVPNDVRLLEEQPHAEAAYGKHATKEGRLSLVHAAATSTFLPSLEVWRWQTAVTL